MRASAIVVAAGSGQRLGFSIPKAFVELKGNPIVFYSLRTLARLRQIIEAIITVPHGMECEARRAAQAAGLNIPVKLTPGGAEREGSVRKALALVSAESDIVVVHDAARPFASTELFSRCIATAAKTGGAIAAMPLADTLKQVSGGLIVATRPRARLYLAQTPQAFKRELLVEAHRAAHDDGGISGESATDDAELVERIGGKVEVVEGSLVNLKITLASDLALAELLAPSSLVPH